MKIIMYYGKAVSVDLLIDRIYVCKSNNSPVNPMYFRDGTPYLPLRGNNDWWERRIMIAVTVP